MKKIVFFLAGYVASLSLSGQHADSVFIGEEPVSIEEVARNYEDDKIKLFYNDQWNLVRPTKNINIQHAVDHG